MLISIHIAHICIPLILFQKILKQTCRKKKDCFFFELRGLLIESATEKLGMIELVKICEGFLMEGGEII